MYQGHMEKTKGGRIEGGKGMGVVGWSGVGGNGDNCTFKTIKKKRSGVNKNKKN